MSCLLHKMTMLTMCVVVPQAEASEGHQPESLTNSTGSSGTESDLYYCDRQPTQQPSKKASSSSSPLGGDEHGNLIHALGLLQVSAPDAGYLVHCHERRWLLHRA
jgi:hypothetical protein